MTDSDGKKPPQGDDPNVMYSFSESGTGFFSVPSVSKLLNRKKLTRSKGYKSPPPFSQTQSTKKVLSNRHAGGNTRGSGISLKTERPSSPSLVVENLPNPAKEAERLKSVPPPLPEIERNHPPDHPEPVVPLVTSKESAPFTEAPEPKAPAQTKAAPPPTPAVTPVKESTKIISLQKVKRKQSAAQELVRWTPELLEKISDPMGKGILQLMKKGGTDFLFMQILPLEAGLKVPHFIATATFTTDTRAGLWSGFRWNPTVVPKTWNTFLKTGYSELTSNENVIRAALGAKSNESLLFVRVGPSAACRGVLAVFSNKSLVTELASVLPLISSPLSVPLAKAS